MWRTTSIKTNGKDGHATKELKRWHLERNEYMEGGIIFLTNLI